MSALGKLSHAIGRSGKQSAALLLDGYYGGQLANVCLVRFHHSHGLHHEASSSALLKPTVSQHNQVRGFFRKSNDGEIDPISKLPLKHPNKGSLMYSGKWGGFLKHLKFCAFGTSTITLLSQPLLMPAATNENMLKISVLASLSTFFFLTPLPLHFALKKYVTDIYYNDDTKIFTLATRSFFCRRKELEYKAVDVDFQFLPSVYVTHIIKGQSFFITEEDFKDIGVYKHMVGFDKPFDLDKREKKKFGLFEDEKDKRSTEPAPYVPMYNMMYDDDDDVVRKQKEQLEKEQEKQLSKVGSK